MKQANRKLKESSLPQKTLPQTIAKEMSISEDAFAKLVARIDGATIGLTGRLSGHYRIRNESGQVDIRCRRKHERILGSLSIPVLEVKLDFKKYDPSQIDAFIKSFNRVVLFQAS